VSPHEYCVDKVAKRGMALFYAVFQLPSEKRDAVIAIHAFRREVEEVVAECSDPALGAVKLEWWRQQLAAVYGGTPQHPVGRALQPAVAAYQLPESDFLAIIEGAETDLTVSRHPHFAALVHYCEQMGSAPNALTARILGCADPLTVDWARELGIATRLSRMVRDIGLDARRDRIYLPADEMTRYGVAPAEVLHGRHTDRFRQLVEYQIDRIDGIFGRALADLPALDRKAQHPLLALAAMARALLREIRADGCRVLDRRTSLTPLRKLWIAWRAG
jgi:phytoene synthase